MDCLHDFDEELKIVFETCENTISSYPPIFRVEALEMFKRYNIFADGFNRNYISFLLPFWLSRPFNIDRETVIQIAAGNIFGLLYFMEQDRVMDADSGEYGGDRLPLANLFYLDFIYYYQKVFPNDSPVWVYLKQYIGEWASCVLHERKGFWKQEKDFNPEDLLMLAHKAAPLKITCAALCILSGKPNMIENVCKMVDTVVISFQLLDDYVDWREDLNAGNCTYFLSQIMKYCNIKDIRKLNGVHYTSAVYTGGLLEKMFSVAKSNHVYLEQASNPSMPYLIEYHKALLGSYNDILNGVEEEKKVILYGGLGSWFSNI